MSNHYFPRAKCYKLRFAPGNTFRTPQKIGIYHENECKENLNTVYTVLLKLMGVNCNTYVYSHSCCDESGGI